MIRSDRTSALFFIGLSVFICYQARLIGLGTLRKPGPGPAPLILAFVLGPLMEIAFRQSMIGSDGSFMVFIGRPISALLMLVTLGIIVTAFVKKRTFVTSIEKES